jgi:hypothetical protein
VSPDDSSLEFGPTRSACASASVGRPLSLAFIRTAHYWTETHPELEYEPDMLLLLKEHDVLAQLLLDQSEAERSWSPMERARLLSALAAREAVFLVSMVSRPPSGIASRALMAG